MRAIKFATREAREIPSRPQNANYVVAMAILQNNALSNIVANLFVNFSKPPYPTRLLTSEDEAVAWLKEFIE